MAKLIVRLADYLKYLKKKGLVPAGRKGGTHERWDYPQGSPQLPRPVTVDHHYNEVPEMHIRTNASTLGMTLESTREEMIQMGIIKVKGSKRRSQ